MEQGGTRWERLQYAKSVSGQPREYRMLNSAMLKLDTVAMKELKDTVHDSSQWGIVGLPFRTVAFRNDMFQLSSSLGCGIIHKHVAVNSNFPCAAALWLTSADGMQAEYDRTKCKQLRGELVQ